MEYSRYNRLCKMEEDGRSWLLYNFLTGALVKLDEEHKRIYEHLLEEGAMRKFSHFYIRTDF